MDRIIAPSILAADFGNLQRDVEMINNSAAEWIHCDIMDGMFVPNISFGFPVLEVVKKYTKKIMDVHLMIDKPERYIEKFGLAGAEYLTVHQEASIDLKSIVHNIKSHGMKAGVSIKPNTPVEVLTDIISELDLVLIMSVEPGYGGQSFMESSYEKIRKTAKLISEKKSKVLIEVDGGVGEDNAEKLFEAGVNVLVAGTSVFKADDPKDVIRRMLEV